MSALFEKRHVTSRDLAIGMSVSEATVRRDLKSLADSGQVELVYGGATLRRPADYSFRSKGSRNTQAKRIIGKLAASLVGDDDQIFLDSGTTCFEMIPYLKSRRRLSIIVNSARLALELDGPGLSVILLGGQYRPDRMDCYGPLAMSTLEQLRGYTCFLGADGLDMQFGPAAADIESAHLNRQALLNARQTVLLADHTKFETPSLFKITDWSHFNQIVTDQRPPQEWMDFFAQQNMQVISPEDQQTEKY